VKVAELLARQRADLSLRARFPGRYEHPSEVVEYAPPGHARLFSGGASRTVKFLREHGAAE